MRIFVTGATGHLGSLVVPDLLQAGHEVVGLARSDTSAAALAAAGVTAHRGDLDDPDGLAGAAAAADGVVHLAFKHDWADFAEAAATDLRAIETIGTALTGSGKPFVISSGTLTLTGLRLGRTGTEADALPAGTPSPRVASENAAVALAERGVRASVVRLPPMTHGPADAHGFVPRLIGIARDKGIAAYVADGANRWPAVHELDAARLYRLAVESAPAGSRLHAVGDEGAPFRRIAETIGRRLDVPTVSISPAEAEAHFGFLSAIVALDNPTSSASTQELLGWHPTHPDLLADLDERHYFRD